MTGGPGGGASPRSARTSAPAKLNLGLRIVGRRADGYHLLQSLFVPLDLSDQVSVRLGPEAAADPEVALAMEGQREGVPAGDSNLAVRAAHAFLKAAGLACGVAIQLDKWIPPGAGLGGGSSDAGAVLRLLDGLFPAALARQDLAALALQLGADVPFFLDPRPAQVGGIGEQIEPLEGLPGFSLLLVNPGISLSTASVYEAYDALHPALTPPGARPTLQPFAGLRGDSQLDALAGLLENDLEPAAVRLCPPIARLRERLRGLGALAVGMSGSGPTVFGVFGDEGAAREGLDRAELEAPAWGRVAAPLGCR